MNPDLSYHLSLIALMLSSLIHSLYVASPPSSCVRLHDTVHRWPYVSISMQAPCRTTTAQHSAAVSSLPDWQYTAVHPCWAWLLSCSTEHVQSAGHVYSPYLLPCCGCWTSSATKSKADQGAHHAWPAFQWVLARLEAPHVRAFPCRLP